MRTTGTMTDVLASGDADFVAMARPFIREPDLVRKLEAGRTGGVECVSCNMCLAHDGWELQCWRDTPANVIRHIRKNCWTNRPQPSVGTPRLLEPASFNAVISIKMISITTVPRLPLVAILRSCRNSTTRCLQNMCE